MHGHVYPHRVTYRRRGVIALQVGVMLVVLLGFAALTVDLGSLFNTRADLQRTADAAALAGASAYTTDEMMQIRQGTGNAGTLSYVTGLASTRVVQFSGMNPTFGAGATAVESQDILMGWIDLNSPSDTVHANPQPRDFNAVRVMVRREAGGGTGTNGPVLYFFAPIFGQLVGETSASAVAVFDDRFSGFAPDDPGAANISPFTVHEDFFAVDLALGIDEYAYDSGTGSVGAGSDGVAEFTLFPYNYNGNVGSDGSGNFGVLNIGTGNQGSSTEEQQILNGVTGAELDAEIRTSEPSFYDSGGNSVTYDITGSPGIDSSLKDPVTQIIGEVIGFFLHSSVVESGSNAVYTITALRFGRVMGVRLTGPPRDRGIYIQPVSYSGAGVRIDPGAPSSGGMVGLIVLAR